ncbi:hypothetical protein B6I21_03400 [candidate division KSB1 bacterium 4572_119]|nr:MAG: hypothetical protein B6I21_03400 [candidate division KSB1 bacterium 4572_119]
MSFDCLTLGQGLSQSTVTSIVQDDEGYMWFGTIDGLNRYCGYGFKVFKNNPNDSTSIEDNIIMSLCKGRDGTIWAGTLSRGLSKFDHKTGKFFNFPINSRQYNSEIRERVIANLPFTFSYLNYYSIKAVFEDSNENLWVGTFGGGLYQFNKEKKEFVHYPYDNGDTTGIAHNIMSICETVRGKESILWLGTYGGGLIKYEQKNGFQYYTTINGLSDNRIVSVYPDSISGKQVLWIATMGGGLNLFDIKSETFIQYRNDPKNLKSISSDFIFSVLRDNTGDLWVGTFDAGLNRLKKNNGDFDRFLHDSKNVNSLGSNEVLSLFEDRSGVIWIGTNFGFGINSFSRGKNLFNHFHHDPNKSNSLIENVVFSICEDKSGTLWVGTFQSGLNKINCVSEEFTNYRFNAENPNSISDNHIRSIYEDSRGRLWLGTFGGGLNYFNRKENKFEHFMNEPGNPNSISGNQVRSIYEDELGNLWLAIFGGGLEKFNPEERKFTHFRHLPGDSTSIGDDRAYFVTGDRNGSLWIGTFGGGISHLDIKTGLFSNFSKDPNNKNSLCDNRILAIHIDEQNKNLIWLGSFGAGFDKFDFKNRSFKNYSLENGLPNNVVYGILPDEKGNLWLSTNKGLSKFNPETEIFVNYDITDGLQSNEFNAGAFCKSSRTGEMFFGGVNGFNSFFPRDIIVNEVVPNIVLTSFKIFDKEMTDSIGSLYSGKEIKLKPNDNFFSFEFSVLDFKNTGKNQFAYKMHGLDDDWIYCGNRNYVNFTNLDPGEYIFQVKGANSDGVWNESGTFIKLKLKPYYYQTWWWYPGIIGLLMIFIILNIYYRLRIKLKRSLQMERIRSQENEKVRKDIAADFHDELGQKLTRISLLSEIVKRELKTISPKGIEYVERIGKVANELSNSTRDFIWSLDPGKNSLYDIGIYLKDFGDDMFDKSGIDFRVKGISKKLADKILFVGAKRHLILIFKEAMHNALKHSKARNATFEIRVENTNIIMSLIDDGIGFSGGKRTSGHGLKNMKTRSDKLKGNLVIKSNEKEGTKVVFIGEITQMGD